MFRGPVASRMLPTTIGPLSLPPALPPPPPAFCPQPAATRAAAATSAANANRARPASLPLESTCLIMDGTPCRSSFDGMCGGQASRAVGRRRCLALLLAAAEVGAADLARGRERQLVDELEMPRVLVGGQVAADELADLLLELRRGLVAVGELDEGLDRLP